MEDKVPVTKTGFASLNEELKKLKYRIVPILLQLLKKRAVVAIYQKMLNITQLENNKVLLKAVFKT